ncbi:hypothetical protein [Sideroxydans sp. CL21]|uniref:hypothetical protein n=1 Tax=Sideroxydans sp. CL21 TaxID=2600596 RepID=UPI0012A79AE6|nr:hypothetical protein [Sideroxydans sp. CL21]VVC83326.1 hypothetical protein [Sideroxydans sp. CL21]
MATKKIAKTDAKQPAQSDKEKAEYVAKVSLMPSVNAAAVVSEYAKAFGEQDISELTAQLREKIHQVEDGDLKLCEAMLVGQANALQAIFVSLARRAVNQEYLKQYETYLRLALKAQNQSRMTLETLATIKNPPVVFARQANINQGNGNQQVNNGTPSPAARAEKNINQQNELLEVQHGGETVDGRATGATGGKDQAMATVD